MRKLEHVGNEFDRQTGMSGLWNSLCVESNCHSVPKCCGGKDDLKK